MIARNALTTQVESVSVMARVNIQLNAFHTSTYSVPPAGQKAAPAAGLAGHRTHLFGEFIGQGFIIIYSGIVGGPDNGDDRKNAGRDVFGNVLARAE